MLLATLACVATAEAQPYVYLLGRTTGTPRRNVLTVIDGVTNTKGPQITLGTSNAFIQPQAMAIAPDGARVYVVNDLEESISVVSTASNAVETTWGANIVGAQPRVVAVSADSHFLYVGRRDGVLTMVDVRTGTTLANLALNFGSIFGIATSPDGSRVYAMATGTDRLVILGATPLRVLTSIDLGLEVRLLRGDAVELSPDGRFVYLPQRSTWVNSCGTNPNCVPTSPPGSALPARVSVFDTVTNSVVANTTTGGIYDPVYHTAVSPDGSVIYAPNTGRLVRLSATTYGVTGDTAGLGGRAVAFLSSTRAYVVQAAAVAVVDATTHTMVTTVPVSATVEGTPTAVVTTPPPPPEPPSSLRATVDGNRVTLAWDAPSTGTVAGYVLEGGATPGSVLASIPTGQNTPGFSFDAPSGAFYIRIHALGAGRRSAPSNEIQILVNVPRPPSAPESLRGLTDGSNLLLSWANGMTGGTPSSLQLDVSGAVTTSLPLPVSESFSYAGVPAGTYTFTVRAANATGSSLASSPVTLTFPGTCPGAPQAPSNFTVTRQGAQLTVNWDPPSGGAAVSSYVLNVSGAVNLSLPMPGRTISGGVAPGTYQLSVQAVNSCGIGPASAVQSVTVP